MRTMPDDDPVSGFVGGIIFLALFLVVLFKLLEWIF